MIHIQIYSLYFVGIYIEYIKFNVSSSDEIIEQTKFIKQKCYCLFHQKFLIIILVQSSKKYIS